MASAQKKTTDFITITLNVESAIIAFGHKLLKVKLKIN